MLKAHLRDLEDGLAIVWEEANVIASTTTYEGSQISAELLACHNYNSPQLELLKVKPAWLLGNAMHI